MTVDIRNVFGKARALDPAPGERISVLPGSTINGYRTWFGYDSHGQTSAVFESDGSRAPEGVYRVSDSVRIEFKKVDTEFGHTTENIDCCVLVCTDPELETAFISFLEDVIERRTSGASTPSAISEAANHLRNLLEILRTPLSEQKAQGLFGELSFLYNLASVHGPAAVAMWTGPNNKQHDFTSRDGCVEVKTCTLQNRTEAKINGLKQLAPLSGVPLALAVAQVVTGVGQTIDDLIVGLAEFGITYRMLEPMLENIGYTSGMLGSKDHQFRIENWRFWNVTEESPVLSDKHLDQRTVDAIGNVHYTLHLSELGQSRSDLNTLPIMRNGAS